MRKLCNTLYVTNPKSYLSRDGESVVVSVDSQEAGRVPIRNLEGIVCFGFLGASPQVMELCTQFGVGLSFVSPYGKYLAHISGKPSGNVLLRKKQYYVSDDEQASSNIAAHFILGKILNCKSVLLRFSRDHPEQTDSLLLDAAGKLSDGVRMLRENEFSLNELRGVEGELSHQYFDCFDDLILSRDPAFCFEVRSRRPPLNRINALLSFSYSLLAADCATALQSVGLDPQVGFLHRIRPGRPSLALDLMEEFRPYLGDRFVLSLINNRIVQADDFVVKENGAVLLKDDARRTVLQTWQKRKSEEVFHPYLEEKIAVGLLPYAQALLLARHLRGDIDAYPPFIMK
ncbi:MAG: type I-C CRISPR-associated endonuclease Cas1c [Methanocorpusculum sp.]|nr:type I-C CRISPR-associated endonuclease Cas1c [Methanocorpusculum sp.]